MAQRNKPPNFSLHAKKIIKERPRMVAIESAKFFKDSFVKGGFTNEAFQPWRKTKSPLGGKKILIGKDNTMNLMQSIRALEENEKRVRVGTDLVYGEIHNDGGIITVTAKMKKFWWLSMQSFQVLNWVIGKRERKLIGKIRNHSEKQKKHKKASMPKQNFAKTWL